LTFGGRIIQPVAVQSIGVNVTPALEVLGNRFFLMLGSTIGISISFSSSSSSSKVKSKDLENGNVVEDCIFHLFNLVLNVWKRFLANSEFKVLS
jgi:hypothetical protein